MVIEIIRSLHHAALGNHPVLVKKKDVASVNQRLQKRAGIKLHVDQLIHRAVILAQAAGAAVLHHIHLEGKVDGIERAVVKQGIDPCCNALRCALIALFHTFLHGANTAAMRIAGQPYAQQKNDQHGNKKCQKIPPCNLSHAFIPLSSLRSIITNAFGMSTFGEKTSLSAKKVPCSANFSVCKSAILNLSFPLPSML